MSKFSKKFCGKSPVKQYKEEVVINESNAVENLAKAEYSRIGDGSIKPAITKEHIKQTEKEHDAKIKSFDENTLRYQYPEKGNPAIEMTGNPVEWLIGAGAAKPAFNLFKNVTRRVADKVTRYAKSQLPKATGEAGVDITQNYFRK